MRNIFLFFTFLIFVPMAKAESYYFSPNGSDTNPGTLTRPWRTLDRLISAKEILRPGDTVYFRGGNYLITDSSLVNDFAWTAKGTVSARITYKNYPNEKPVIIYDRRNTVSTHRIVAQPGSFSTFDGLTFRQTEASRQVAIGSGSAYADYNTYYSKSVRAIYITTQNVILRNCVIDNFSSIGLGIRGANAIIESNTFKNNANHTWYIQGAYGIYRNNILDGNRQMAQTGRYGIQIQYVGSHHNKIYSNVIKNSAAGGIIYSGKVAYNEVFNNVLINAGNNRSSGCSVCAWTEDGPVGEGNRFYNNSVIGKTVYAILGGKLSQMPKIDIRDNIFYPSSEIPIGYSGSNLRNNIFYNVSGTIPAGNKRTNPLLTNPFGSTEKSAELSAASPAINAGLSSTYPKTDFYGRIRTKQYDIGAFEYGVSSTLQPLAPLGLKVKYY